MLGCAALTTSTTSYLLSVTFKNFFMFVLVLAWLSVGLFSLVLVLDTSNILVVRIFNFTLFFKVKYVQFSYSSKMCVVFKTSAFSVKSRRSLCTFCYVMTNTVS